MELSSSEFPQKAAPLFVAVDASTTSIKSIIYDHRGNELSMGRAALAFNRIGREGYEQDANSWWQGLCRSLKTALASLAQERHQDILTLTIAHQRETIAATTNEGSPLGPALLWMDSRCRFDVEVAERDVGSVRLHAVSGKPSCTTPSMYKLMYMLRLDPSLRECAFFHDVHSFLSKKLTGRSVSSFASADPSGLVDMRKKAWSHSLTRLVGIGADRLPELVEVGHLIGPLTKSACQETGLPAHLLMYAGGGDGQLAGLGAGVTQKGKAFLDLGTAVSCGTLTDKYEIDSSFRTLHAATPGRYCVETTLKGGMLTLWWLVDNVMGSTSRNETIFKLEREAEAIAATSEGLVTLPYWTGAMNPYWDDATRGAFIGLHPSHRPVHLFRSILEGIALEQRLHLEGIQSAIGRSNDELVAIGGGSRSDLWCQILADVFGRSIRRARTENAPALGAAVLAAVAHGFYPSLERAAEEMTQLAASFEPGPDQPIYDRLYRDVYRGLYLELKTRMTSLHEIRELASPNGGHTLPPPVDVEQET